MSYSPRAFWRAEEYIEASWYYQLPRPMMVLGDELNRPVVHYPNMLVGVMNDQEYYVTTHSPPVYFRRECDISDCADIYFAYHPAPEPLV